MKKRKSKRNAQDTTLRNVKASNRRDASLMNRIGLLEKKLSLWCKLVKAHDAWIEACEKELVASMSILERAKKK